MSEGPDLSQLRRLSQNAKPPRRQRQDVNLARAGAFLGAALVVIVLPWVVFNQIGDPGPASSRPKTSASPTPVTSRAGSASPAPSALPDAGIWEVVGDVECARIRVSPGTNEEILNCVKPGTRLTSDGQLKTVDNFAWLHVEDPFKKLDGWIATRYVKKL
jgi:hypothetical protein